MSRSAARRPSCVKVVAPPVGLVGAVLGSIIAGIAAPSEAASMGALGSILIAAVTGRLSWRVLRETCQATVKITAMMMFILMCAQVFALAFRGLQGEKIWSRISSRSCRAASTPTSGS